MKHKRQTIATVVAFARRNPSKLDTPSKPHTTPQCLTLNLTPCVADTSAFAIAQRMRKGRVATTNDLSVLDALITSLPDEDLARLKVWSGTRLWDIDMLQRIRLRGLDPRPRT